MSISTNDINDKNIQPVDICHYQSIETNTMTLEKKNLSFYFILNVEMNISFELELYIIFLIVEKITFSIFRTLYWNKINIGSQRPYSNSGLLNIPYPCYNSKQKTLIVISLIYFKDDIEVISKMR